MSVAKEPLVRFKAFLEQHGCVYALELLTQHSNQLSRIQSLDTAITGFMQTIEASENPSPSI